MDRWLVRSTLLVLLVLSLFSNTSTSRAAPHLRQQTASSAYDLVNAVSALRASYGLAPYSISPILMMTAQAHADYMAATGNVSHTGLGGASVTERLLAAGYPLAGDLSLGGFRSENITAGNESKTAQDAVNAWTGDELHLTTMVSSSLTEIGAGVSVNGGRVYYVIDCALPTDAAPQPAAGTPVGTVTTVVPGGGVIVPMILATPNADGDVIHEVKAGQTLWQIALAYETRIDEIKRLNHLYNNDIYPGDRLLIRSGIAISTTIPVTATVDIPATETLLPPVTPTVTALPSITAVAIATPLTVSTSRIMSAAIGIITLALLAGIFFISNVDSRQTNPRSKE